MKASDAMDLVQLVKALCPGQPMVEGTARAWALILSDVSAKDAAEAARRVYVDRGSDKELGARRLEPDDILREVKRMRLERVDAAPPFAPSRPDLSPAEQIAELRAYRKAAGNGDELPALPAAGTRSLPRGLPRQP